MEHTQSLIYLYSLISIASALVRVGGEVALVVIVFGVVRRHRPDAWHGLRAWAITSLCLGLFWTIAWRVWPMFAGTTDTRLEGQMALSMLGIATEVVLVVLLIRGLVAIAQPPKPPPPIEAPPYR